MLGRLSVEDSQPASQGDGSTIGREETGESLHDVLGHTESDDGEDVNEKLDGLSQDEMDVVMGFVGGLKGIADKMADGPFNIEWYVQIVGLWIKRMR